MVGGTKDDPLLTVSRLSWITGVGKTKRPDRVSGFRWLFQLLTRTVYDRTHGATAEAEDVAGITPSIYWWVGTCDDHHGSVVVTEWVAPAWDSPNVPKGGLCPCDTGGLLREDGKYEVEPPFATIAERIEYFSAIDLPLDGWEAAVSSAIIASYDRPADYAMAQPPQRPMTPRDHVTRNRADSTKYAGAWSWEARVHRDAFADSEIKIAWLLWQQPGLMRAFLRWVQRHGDASDVGVQQIAEMIARSSEHTSLTAIPRMRWRLAERWS